MLALLSNHGNEPRYVAAYIAMLMDRDEITEARRWLTHLAEIAPANSLTITLRAESLVRSQQTEAAIQSLRDFVEKGPAAAGDRDARLLKVASILSASAGEAGARANDTKLPQSARDVERASQGHLLQALEGFARDYASRHPEHGLLVAGVVARQGRVDEALKIMEQALPKANAESLAGESLQVIAAANLSASQAARLDRMLQDAAAKKGRPVPILLVLGDLWLRQRPAAAVAIYREVLAKDENNIVALNNLALLLSLEKKDVAEALRLVDKAIDIAGPVRAILDTRAAARLANGQPQEALADLEDVIREDPQADRYFHQALAYWQLGQQRQAKEAFQAAQRLGLRPEGLLVLERPDYEELARKLAL